RTGGRHWLRRLRLQRPCRRISPHSPSDFPNRRTRSDPVIAPLGCRRARSWMKTRNMWLAQAKGVPWWDWHHRRGYSRLPSPWHTCRTLGTPSRASPGIPFAAEDAALVVPMMQFGAAHPSAALQPEMDLRREHHSDQWRGEVDPERFEAVRSRGRPERARRVHAHPGDRPLEGVVRGDEESAEEAREAVGAPGVGRDECD